MRALPSSSTHYPIAAFPRRTTSEGGWTGSRLHYVARRSIALRLAGALLLATPIGAKAASGALQLSYSVPTACPTRADFTSSLSVRVSRLALTDDTQNRLLSVGVVASEDGYRGVLRLFVGGAPAFERVLVDRNCDALLEAL